MFPLPEHFGYARHPFFEVTAVSAEGEIEKVGATVVAVVCIVDRLEGAREALARYTFSPIYTIRDFGVEPPQR